MSIQYKKSLMACCAIAVCGLLWSCLEEPRAVPSYRLDPVPDARTLPYKFVVRQEHRPTDDRGRPIAEEHVPLDLYGDNITRMYAVQSGWAGNGTLSSIVFFGTQSLLKATNHENFTTSRIESHHPADLDNDDTLEVLVTYVAQDTAWLEVVDPVEGKTGRHMIAVGQDRDDNGFWDGRPLICGAADLNNDGFLDVLVSTDVGYDLLPRMIVCVDVRGDSTLWKNDIAGFLDPRWCRVANLSAATRPTVICGISSKGNRVSTRYMDDSHSYLLALNPDGSMRWFKRTGDVFTAAFFQIGDYDDDGINEIVAARTYKTGTSSNPSSTQAALIVYNADGVLVDSIPVGEDREFHSFAITDTDMEGHHEYVASLSDSTIVVFASDLSIKSECKLYTMGHPIDSRDFLGFGSRQLMITTDDNLTWLLSDRFVPLGQFSRSLQYDIVRFSGSQSGTGEANFITCADKGTVVYRLSIEQSPWFSVFFRKPWLASVAAAIPLSLIIGIIALYSLRIRQKNHVISKARDDLVETQQRLIESEKYAQARDIAGAFAHKIRNALFPTTVWLHQLNEATTVSGGRVDHLEKTRHAVARVVDFTSAVTQYTSLKTSGSIEQADIKSTIADVLSIHSSRVDNGGLAVTITCPKGVRVSVNPQHLRTAIDNLVTNSLDALADTDGAGRLMIDCSVDSDDVVLVVEDNGCGIESENLERVFDAFYSTKPTTGLGLGLALVKKTVEMYNGSIEVMSNPNNGTTFTLRLPSI